MFSGIRNFVDRHKRKFIITGVVVGGAYLVTGYAQRKLREWQERETRKFLEVTRKKQHFESTERTCNQTILNLSRVLSESVNRLLDTDEILNLLKENPDNKLELWERLKIITFTRICTLVYAFCILVVTLRMQLNIIGGYLYKDSAQGGTSPPVISSALQEKYLSLCNNLVWQRGLQKLSQQIEEQVKSVILPISLKKKLTLQDIEQIFWSIQATLTGNGSDPVRQMVNYLIVDVDTSTDPIFERLLNETMELLESEEVVSLSLSCVGRCFSLIIDQIAYVYSPKSQLNEKIVEVKPGCSTSNGVLKSDRPSSAFIDVTKVEMPLAKLIPIVNDLVLKNGCKNNHNIQGLIIQQLTLNDSMKVLGANVYEAFAV